MSEQEIINLLKPLAASEALGLEDDAAIVPAGDIDWCITKDVIVEGTHFLPDTSPETLAQKLLRVNLSDMMAMGATPKFYMIAAMLPDLPDDFHARFIKQLKKEQTQYDIALLGGDTCSTSGNLSYSLTMLGTLPNGKYLSRGGAKENDIILVSGTIGDAALGLLEAQGELQADGLLQQAYEVPSPPVALGELLLKRGVICGTDCSDGLALELHNMAKLVGLTAEITLDNVPLSTQVKQFPEYFKTAITGGDDYQLIITAASEKLEQLIEIAAENNFQLTQIGRFIARKEQPLRMITKDGSFLKLKKLGYCHG